MNTTPQAALLREAAQNALTTLDGIANANPRDTADFETPAEWIVWAKSRARWAADALREPIAQEVYAERILKQMLHEDSKATQAEPAQAGELPDEREAFEAYMSDNGKWPAAVQRYDNGARGYVLLQTSAAWGTWQARAALSARKPLTDEQRAEVFRAAENRMVHALNLSWRNAVVEEVERAHGIGLEVKT